MNLLLLMIMGITWSLHFALVKLISNTISPLFILFPILVGISLCFIFLQGRKNFIITLRDVTNKNIFLFYIIAGFFGYLLPIFFELSLASNLDAGLLTLIVTTNPIITIILSVVLKVEKASFQKIISAFVGFLGALIIFLPNKQLSPDLITKQWVILAFFIPSTYAVYNIYISKKWPGNLTVMQVATGETIVSSFLALPLFIISFFSENLSILIENLNCILILILVTAIEVWSFFMLIRRAGPVFVSFSTFITLVGGFLWGYIFFNEHINLQTIISSIFIFSALIILSVEPTFIRTRLKNLAVLFRNF